MFALPFVRTLSNQERALNNVEQCSSLLIYGQKSTPSFNALVSKPKTIPVIRLEQTAANALTSALMSLNFVMKACLMTSTATSEAMTMMTSGQRTHRWSVGTINTISDIISHRYSKHYVTTHIPRKCSLYSVHCTLWWSGPCSCSYC